MWLWNTSQGGGNASDDVEKGTFVCLICEDEVPENQGGSCTGTQQQHHLCDSCFCGYARAEFDAEGSFEAERTSSNGCRSGKGELPCFKFVVGECDCSSIPLTTLARVLSTDSETLLKWEQAKRRVTLEEAEQDRVTQSHVSKARTRVERLHLVVTEVLTRGRRVVCPTCGRPGEKDDQCMHISCSCGTRWCYCCGRMRGNASGNCASDGTGCDNPSPYLQYHPEWGDFALPGETNGEGALHEFHRKRMIFFLRQVKESYPVELWEELQNTYPDMLEGVPTAGRSISWDEIDNAIPPSLGRTPRSALLWADEGLQAMLVVSEHLQDDRLQDELPQQHQQTRQDSSNTGCLPRLTGVCGLRQPRTRLWIAGFLLAIVLLLARLLSSSAGLRITGNFLISVLAVTALPALACAAVDTIAEDEDRSCGIHEVQWCWGANGQAPLLSRDGLWSNYRMLYLYSFFGSITIGSFLLANAVNPAVRAVGAATMGMVFAFYGFLTMLVNCGPMPITPSEKRLFLWTSLCLCIHSSLFSVGVGILSAFGHGNVKKCGEWIFAFGFAGVLAEIAPRIRERQAKNEVLWNVPPNLVLVFFYLTFYGFALGALLVALNDEAAWTRAVGILILVLDSFTASVMYWRALEI